MVDFAVGDVGDLFILLWGGDFWGGGGFLGHTGDGGEVGGFVIGFAAFEDGVGGELLLDAFFEGHEGELEDFHGLDHAWGQLHPLVHSHVLGSI